MSGLEYTYSYIIVNLFGTYVIYKFMGCFFRESRAKKLLGFLPYAGYYFLLIFAYFFLNVPLAFLLINIICYFIMTLNYKTTFARRLIAVVSIYMIMLIIESLVAILTFNTQFLLLSQNTYSSVWGLTATKLISYMAALIIGSFKNIRKEIKIPVTYGALVLLLPGGSLYMLLVILNMPNISRVYVASFIACFLLINFAAFHLYDSILASAGKELERAMLREQNTYYKHQLESMEASVAEVSALRHDFANHLQGVKALIGEEDLPEGREYIKRIEEKLKGGSPYSSTRNAIVDGMVNYKLNIARQKNVAIKTKMEIPQDLPLDSFAMVCILGNLLDNAIEGAEKAEFPEVSVSMKYDCGRIVIKITNSYEGELIWKGNSLQTMKKDRKLHGIGLENVKGAVEKLNGMMEVSGRENRFTAVVIFPLES